MSSVSCKISLAGEKAFLLGAYTLGKTRRLYYMALPESEADYQKSRHCYIAGDAAAQTMVQLAGGTFLAGLLTHAGVSESNIGVFTSLASFAALFQLLMIGYLRNLKKCKPFICASVFMKLLFSVMYVIPLMPLSGDVKVAAIIVCYFAAQVFLQIGTPVINDWLASLVPLKIRGTYLAVKDSVAVFFVASLMLGAGIMTDYFKEHDPLMGFLIMGIVLFVLVSVNVVSFSLMKEPRFSYLNAEGKELHGNLARKAREEEKAHFGHADRTLVELKAAFASRRFRKAFLLNCMYITSFYIASPFNAGYQIRELALPYTFIMLVGFLCNLYRVAITPAIGRLADRVGMALVLKYTLLCLGLSFLVMAFTVPGNARWMFVISSVCSASGWTFIGSGLLGVQLEFVDHTKRILQLSLISSVSGAYGFLISMIGGQIMNILTEYPVSLFGRVLFPQQILNMIGFMMIVVTVIYTQSLVRMGRGETEAV